MGEYTASFSTGVETGVILVTIIIIIIIGAQCPEISSHPISLHLCLDWPEEQARVTLRIPLNTLFRNRLHQARLCARSHLARRCLKAAFRVPLRPAPPRPVRSAAPTSGGRLGLLSPRTHPTGARPSRSSSPCI